MSFMDYQSREQGLRYAAFRQDAGGNFTKSVEFSKPQVIRLTSPPYRGWGYKFDQCEVEKVHDK